MPFSFPASPTVGQNSTQNSRQYIWTGYAWELVAASGGGSLSATVSIPALGDPYYANVSLLLHCDGANGSTTITDTSQNPKTFTSSGGSASLSTARAKFGSASLLQEVSSSLNSSSSSDFAFGTGDFTVEFFMNASALPTGEARLVSFGGAANTSLNLVYGYSGYTFTIVNESVAHVLLSTQSVSVNQWHHVAYTRASNTLYLFFNGNLLGTANVSSISTPSSQFSLSPGNGTIYFDDVRVTKGFARYTAAFAPQTWAFADGTSLTVPVVFA